MNTGSGTKSVVAAAIGIIAAVCAGPAMAAMQVISNANFSVTYNDDTRFGTATLLGNALNFNLVNTAAPSTPWIAESLNGAGVASSTSTVTLTLRINDTAYANGYRFSAFDWLEGGDYNLTGSTSSVSVLGQLRAINPALPITTSTIDDLTVLPPGLGIVSFANTNWFADARLDTTTACSGPNCSNVFATDPQQIQLQIENRLTATTSQAVTQAFIEKKLGGGAFTLVVTPIPEASTWAMMLAGLGAVGFMARRRA